MIWYVYFFSCIRFLFHDEHFRWRVWSGQPMLTQIKLNHSCLLIFPFTDIFLIIHVIWDDSWPRYSFKSNPRACEIAAVLSVCCPNPAVRWEPTLPPTVTPKHYDDLDRQMTSICPSLTALTRLSWLKMLWTLLCRDLISLGSANSLRCKVSSSWISLHVSRCHFSFLKLGISGMLALSSPFSIPPYMMINFYHDGQHSHTLVLMRLPLTRL